MQRFLHLSLALALFAGAALAAPQNRIAGPADNGRRVRLTGHLHPRATAANDVGAVNPAETLPAMTIVLKSSPEREAELDKLIAAQQDSASPEFHHWLTPEEFAARFGASQSDLDKMTAWLEQQNLHVTSVARAHNAITFTGTAADVGRAFGTEFRRYDVNGRRHFANATEPAVPAPMAVLVRSIKGLNDFRLEPRMRKLDSGAGAEYTSGSGKHYLAPQDFATIYNVTPLHAQGYDGSGQTIVIAGQTRVDLSDIRLFRDRFQLPANDPDTLLVPGTRDPGTISGDMEEADLDLEWAGAVAPNANIKYVYSYDVMDAVQYAIDNNLAPVISVSYGLCEPLTARSDALAMQSWAKQGNAQGITWFNAAGDSGGADCVTSSSTRGAGLSVDLPAGIPEVTGVGGTTLNEGSGTYWNSNNAADGSSALTYIPEVVWNDSVSGDPASGGGGSSSYFAKPAWQTGSGDFGSNGRAVPDVSLASSAQHNGYMVYNKGRAVIIGGTSAATPALAGIAALLNQYQVATGAQKSAGLGNVNPVLYSLAQSTPSVFHDVTGGDNIVNVTCRTGRRGSAGCTSGAYGFSAGPGYDRASGLGSVDAFNLVKAWRNGLRASTRAAVSIQVTVDASGQVTAFVSGAADAVPSGTVTFSVGDAVIGTADLSASGSGAVASITLDPAVLANGAVVTARYDGDNSNDAAAATGSMAN